MKKYRLHFEGNETVAEQHLGMKAVKDAIKAHAKKAGTTIAIATEYAYIVTEEEYQEEQNP